ncbi:MAG: DNA repair protein RadC [Bacteroidales bacterium]|nr:DNA repair protein RadC [Bacteroidales bacterium]
MVGKSTDRTDERKSIKEWASDDRPREKMMHKGKSALSNAELIAILIGSGNATQSAVALSRSILDSVGNNLIELSNLTLGDLMKHKGIGEAKAVSIMAALELGKRRRVAEASADDIIKDSATAYEHFLFLIDNPGQEHFFVMYLNQNNKLLKTECISKGGLTQVVADPKVIFKSALDIGATNLIVCHNHPSGNPTPSETDRLLTKKLVAAGKLLDIQVTDHIIIGKEQYYSFLERGQMIF